MSTEGIFTNTEQFDYHEAYEAGRESAQAVIDDLVKAAENAKAEIVSNIDPNMKTLLILNDIDKALQRAEEWK